MNINVLLVITELFEKIWHSLFLGWCSILSLGQSCRWGKRLSLCEIQQGKKLCTFFYLSPNSEVMFITFFQKCSHLVFLPLWVSLRKSFCIRWRTYRLDVSCLFFKSLTNSSFSFSLFFASGRVWIYLCFLIWSTNNIFTMTTGLDRKLTIYLTFAKDLMFVSL